MPRSTTPIFLLAMRLQKKFQRESLREAISSAFPTALKLDMLLYERLDTRLNNEVNVQQPYTSIVFEVIRWAEERGRLEELLSEAYQRNPGNPKFRQFMTTYGIDPRTSSSSSGSIGPDFSWQGPEDDRELQGFWKPDPELWDMGFLKRGIDQATAVCRIELPGERAIGTGFLIAPGYLLTNYHVLAPTHDADPKAYFPDITLRFATLTDPTGHETFSCVRQFASNPLRKSSPTHQLDYALLELVPDREQDLQPVRLNGGRSLARNDSIHILQHPRGQSLKVSLSSQGITDVYLDRGLVQYVGKTAVGSSGSPCFNDQWELVAIHRAEVGGSVGVKCEGILSTAIYAEVQEDLL